MKVIKLTENQYGRLFEVDGDGPTLDASNDTNEFSTEISNTTPIHDENGNIKKGSEPNTDDIANSLTYQGFLGGANNVRLQETIKRVLKEYYSQLKIPFNHDTPNYDYKSNYEHYIDFLEKIGKYGKLPKSKWSKKIIRNEINKNLDYAMDNSETEEEEEYLMHRFFLYINNSTLLNMCIEPEVMEYCNNDLDSLSDYLQEDDFYNLKNSLNDEGKSVFDEFRKKYFLEKLNEYGFLDNLTFNNRGLIYVERAITLPKFYERLKDNDFIKKYQSVGECWSWLKDGAEPYCGGDGTTILLKGWVDPSQVDWEETTYRNMYSINDERELYIPSAKVEVFEVKLFYSDSNKEIKLPLHNSILVEA